MTSEKETRYFVRVYLIAILAFVVFAFLVGRASASTSELEEIRNFHNHNAIRQLLENVPASACTQAYFHDCYDRYSDCAELTEHELMMDCLTDLIYDIKQSMREKGE